jgi:hypothetical protein
MFTTLRLPDLSAAWRDIAVITPARVHNVSNANAEEFTKLCRVVTLSRIKVTPSSDARAAISWLN